MPTVTIQEAQNRLSDLVHGLTQGDEIVITENGEPVAKLARRPEKAVAVQGRKRQGDQSLDGAGLRRAT